MKIAEWQGKAKAWTEKTGLRRDYAREAIGTASGKQVYGLGRKLAIDGDANRTISAIPKDESKLDAIRKINGTTNYVKPNSNIEEVLKTYDVEAIPLARHKTQPSDEEIIEKIGGKDITEGSCTPLAFAYIANKAGFDVTDQRGGMSRNIFTEWNTIKKIAQLPGVDSIIETGYDEFETAKKLFKEVKLNKSYYFAIGRHGAIVRKTEALEFLELQSKIPTKNKFKPFDEDTLAIRFECLEHYEIGDIPVKKSGLLIDIDTLQKSEEFINLMQYINTSKNTKK